MASAVFESRALGEPVGYMENSYMCSTWSIPSFTFSLTSVTKTSRTNFSPPPSSWLGSKGLDLKENQMFQFSANIGEGEIILGHQ